MHEEVIMAGTGGQGIMIMGQLLAHAAMTEGYHVVWFPSYGPEARGGTADCTVIVSSEEIGSPISSHPDTLVGMHQFLFNKFSPNVKSGGRQVINTSLVDPTTARTDCRVIGIDANVVAEGLGNVRVANMVMLGAYVGTSGIVSVDTLVASLSAVFPPHRHKLIPLNEAAIRRGVDLAS
ncbi:MAG: 2-oxoacid:acceptor oxidoreductase family protein [Armatimonadota bacterium]